jgi:alkylated DNA repair dioxygenase AlkB
VHVTPIAIVPGVDLYPAFIADPETLLARLAGELDLRQEYINLGRGPVAMPRLTGWYGDPGAVYRYSRLVNVPAPWTLALGALRHELNERLGASLNSCLVNSYRDGASSMGWHSDDEPELRDRIVSVSLGATRTFRLREGRRGATLALDLAAGSVLTMTVESQRNWQHAVPKSANVGMRLNLTFRSVAILPDAARA